MIGFGGFFCYRPKIESNILLNNKNNNTFAAANEDFRN